MRRATQSHIETIAGKPIENEQSKTNEKHNRHKMMVYMTALLGHNRQKTMVHVIVLLGKAIENEMNAQSPADDGLQD